MTKTEISNRALAALGHDRTIDDFDTDSSTEAERCRKFFDSALTGALAAHDWDFAAVERSYNAMPADVNGYVRLPYPADAVRIVVAKNLSERPLPTRRDRDWLFVKSDGQFFTIRFVSSDIVLDEIPFNFSEAVIARLAALLAAPMFGDAAKAKYFNDAATVALQTAIAAETNETAYRGQTENPFIAARS